MESDLAHVRAPLPTAEVAKRAGIHKDTLLRWLRSGLVREPRRDRRGWRSFSAEEAQVVAQLAQASTPTPPLARTAFGDHANGLSALARIDWDFSGAKTNYLTHGLHPYPAKFIPQIPNALIQELSSVGETVGDIFCGSGTTLVEALTLKRNAVGIDANPLACLISEAKIGVLSESNAEILRAIAERARVTGDSISAASSDGLFSDHAFVSSAWRPSYAKLIFWFDQFVIEELAELRSWCQEIPDRHARHLALTAFSSIVVAVSKQDSDTRYVRREKNTMPGDTMRRFARAVEVSISAALEFADVAEPRFTSQVLAADLLDNPSIPPLDLMVCSPPYPNAYSYHLYHMTRMVWLEMDQPRFKREEIGSHRKYSSKGTKAADASTFQSEFKQILSWLSRHLRRGRYACFVVGDSTVRGTRIDNAELISNAGRECGFVEVLRTSRTMQATKKAFNPVIGKIKTERVLVLENRG